MTQGTIIKALERVLLYRIDGVIHQTRARGVSANEANRHLLDVVEFESSNLQEGRQR